MIKGMENNQESLQEAMEIKMYNEYVAKVPECEYEIGLETAFMHNAEIERNYNSIMEQMGLAEMRFYNEFHQMLTFTEAEGGDEAKPGLKEKAAAAGKNFKDKIIAFIEKMRQTLAAAFKKVVTKLSEYTTQNKAFLATYGKKLKADTSKKISIEGYPFKNLDGASVMTFGGKQAVAGNAPAVKIANFAFNGGEVQELKKHIYGEKGTVTFNVQTELRVLENTARQIKELNKAHAGADKAMKEWISEVKKITDKAALENILAKVKSVGQAMNAATSVVCKAYVDRNRQAKAACIKSLKTAKDQESRTVENISKADKKAAAKQMDAAWDRGEAMEMESAILRNTSIEDILSGAVAL